MTLLEGVHPLAHIGGPPEHPDWHVGVPVQRPDVHPTAQINAFCTVDGGMPGMPTTRIGARTFLQASVHVGHNAQVGDDVRLCVNVNVGGEAVIGDGADVAGNSWIKPRVRVGRGALIGGGSVVTKDVPAFEVWAGNPARFMKLTWSHPDYDPDKDPGERKPSGTFTARPGRPVTGDVSERLTAAPSGVWGASEHPYREPEEVWAMMRPWHHRHGMTG